MVSPYSKHVPHRRASDARAWPVRYWFWVTAPLVDGQDGLSLTRFLSIYFALLIGRLVIATNVLTANMLWLAFMCCAVAFGKSTFTFFLMRLSMKSTTKDSVAITGDISKIIDSTWKARQGQDYEPAP